MTTSPLSPASRHPDGTVTVERRGRVLLIGIDRVEKRNGFTPKMLSELSAACAELDDSDDVFVGLLFAHGEHFSAGLDLVQFAPLLRAGKTLVTDGTVDPFNLREPMRRKPMVMALQGICFTVAVELMLACEVSVAADNCRFAQLEVQRGIVPTGGATIRMVQRAGWGNAMQLLLTGQEFDAQHALRLGFVQEVVPAGRQFGRALEIAHRIAEQAPLAVQAVVENARLALGVSGLEAWKQIEVVQQHLSNTEDAHEGVQSFRDKRPARFVGR